MPSTPTRRSQRSSAPLLAAVLLAVAAGLAAGACRSVERALGTRPATPHQRYAESLREAGLDARGLGRDWLAASRRAAESPVAVTLPFRETGYFAADRAPAVGYRFAGRRGQRLVVEVQLESADPAALFVDLYEPDPDTAPPFRHLASADSGRTRLDVELERDGPHLLRLQPELLRSARWTVTVQAVPTLAFPVEGRDTRAVRSRFGVERDGGRRSHQGIDIFAPRGTPVLAATAGVVRNVGVNRLGGNVVWLWDEERRQALYYAHLDTQLVAAGVRVRPGDTLGLVGNTGNARTTPPHLHFGIYRRGEGALDPYPFVHRSRDTAPAALADTVPLDHWARVAVRATRARQRAQPRALPRAQPLALLRAGADSAADSLDALSAGTLVRVSAGNSAWRRVTLPDGRTGYLRPRDLAPAERPLAERALAATPLREAPTPVAIVMDSLAAGTEVAIVGRFGDFALVRPDGGLEGWVEWRAGGR